MINTSWLTLTCNETSSNQKPDAESYKIHDAANYLEHICHQKYNLCVMSDIWPSEKCELKQYTWYLLSFAASPYHDQKTDYTNH